MFTAYVVVTVLAAAANTFSATLDFIHFKRILINMARAGVPESWITKLGILKAAGALGLVVGIGVPLIGTAAAVGLITFFVAAIITHLRAHDYSFGLAIGFLLLAVAALAVELSARGPVALAV
jgi:DoxX-like family